MTRCPRLLVLLFALVPGFLGAQPTTQTNIALATNGLDFLASFAEDQTPAVATLRFDTKTFGPTHKLASTNMSLQPLAYGSNLYLHVSQQGQAVVARRIALDGTIIDQTPIVLATLGSVPAVASDGKDFMVLWADLNLKAAVVHADGTVEPTRTLIERAGWGFSSPRIAFDGTRYAITYSAKPIPLFPFIDSRLAIEAATVTRDGVMGTPIVLFPSYGTTQPDAPIASSGRDFVVVGRMSDGKEKNDLVAYTLVASGSSLSLARQPITLFRGLDSAASVAWTGRDYLIAWRAFGFFNFPTEHPDSFLELTHLRLDGTFDPISAIPTGPHGAPLPAEPAVAVDDFGVEMIVIDQLESIYPRARAYRAEDVSGHHVDPPAAPLVTSAKETSGGVQLTWTRQSANERGFILQRGSNPDHYQYIAVPAGTTTFTMPVQTPVSLRIKAWNEAGLSPAATVTVLPPHRFAGRR